MYQKVLNALIAPVIATFRRTHFGGAALESCGKALESSETF